MDNKVHTTNSPDNELRASCIFHIDIKILAPVEPLSPRSLTLKEQVQLRMDEVYTLSLIYQADIVIHQEPSLDFHGKFDVKLESTEKRKYGCWIVFEIGYTKRYPCESPLLRCLSKADSIQSEEADSILEEMRKQADFQSKYNLEHQEEKEGMIFKLLQMAKARIDKYALKIEPIEIHVEEVKAITPSKDPQMMLNDFIRKVNAEKERQKVQINCF